LTQVRSADHRAGVIGKNALGLAVIFALGACEFQKPATLDPELERRIAQKQLALAGAKDGNAEAELAELYLEGERFFDAAEHFQFAAVKGTAPERIAAGLALTYLELGYIPAMVEQLKICFKIDQAHPDCLYAFGSLLERDGSESALQEARRTYQRFLAVAPSSHRRIAYVKSTLEQLNARLKEVPDTEAPVQQNDPHGGGGNPHGGGDAPHAGGAPSGVPGHDGAKGDEDVGELNPFGKAISKAIDAANKGDIPGAEAAFREALKVAPQDAGALAGLADTLYAQKKDADARATIDKARSIDPKDPQVRYVFGLIYLEDKTKQKEALESWASLLADDPGYAAQLKLADRMKALKK
jgi:tetratricopeptide (TPR) repeat protein